MFVLMIRCSRYRETIGRRSRDRALPPNMGAALSTSSDASLGPLVRKLESIFSLSDEERQALSDLPVQVKEFAGDQIIMRQGDRPSRSFAILEGFAASFQITTEGKRQILAFHVPGDMPDLHSFHLHLLDYGVGTITACKMAFTQHQDLRELLACFPRLTDALWRKTLIDGAISRAWMTNLGQRPASARMAHHLCEMVVRLKVVGLAPDHTCDLPITQAVWADALGMSQVHVNRVLQELRKTKLIHLKGRTLTVLDWVGLTRAGEFDPSYLHLRDGQPAG